MDGALLRFVLQFPFMNYGYDSLNCFTLILCGEPHLNSTLRKPVHEALRQSAQVVPVFMPPCKDVEVCPASADFCFILAGCPA